MCQVFWEAEGEKHCSKTQADDVSSGTCTGGKMDDPTARTAEHVYWVDEENSGFEKYSPTSRTLASTLTIIG